MKLTRIDSPTQVKQVTTNETAAKTRAVQAFQQTQALVTPQETPVNTATQPPIPVNANNISAEEISAVKAQNPGQNRTDVADTTQPKAQQETPPIPETASEKLKDDASQQYQLLARKERQLRAKAQADQQALKAERDKFTTEKQALEARIAELEQNSIPKQRIKERAFETLIEEGVTYDEITQQAIDAQQKNPRYEAYINKLEAKIAKLEEKTSKAEAQQQEAQSQQYKAALKQIESDVISLVKTDPNYEAIRATKSVKDVVELIERTFQEEGRVLSVDEAAQEVEDYLIEEASKLAKLTKVQKRNAPATPPPQTKTQPPQQPQTMKTLTNAASSTRKLSAKERALLAFEGKLER